MMQASSRERSSKAFAVLIVSDFHLGAGPDSGEHDAFVEDAAFCALLDHYARDVTLPELTLVLNGDFFDSLEVQVHGELPTRVYEAAAAEKIASVLAGHAEVFEALACFARRPGRDLIFVVGNHDIALAFPAVQTLLRDRLGGAAFATDPIDLGGLRITHGHAWDEANCFDAEGPLGEDEGGRYVRFPWGSFFVLDYVRKVRRFVPQIDHIKPLGAFMRWAFRHRPRDAWIGFFWFVLFVLKYRFARAADRRFTFLRLWKIFRGSCLSCTFVSEAAALLSEEGLQVLVAGHTHAATCEPLHPGAVYANTGAWTPLVRFRDGRFEVCFHRTFALARRDATSGAFEAEGLALLEWIPGEGPVPYEAQAHDLHLHHRSLRPGASAKRLDERPGGRGVEPLGRSAQIAGE